MADATTTSGAIIVGTVDPVTLVVYRRSRFHWRLFASNKSGDVRDIGWAFSFRSTAMREGARQLRRLRTMDEVREVARHAS